MKKYTTLILVFFLFALAYSQEKQPAFKEGEWLRYKMSYSGFLRAGSATLQVKEETLNGKKVYHTIGKGWTSGPISWFFKVNDNYQSYFDKETIKPYLFKRKIDEGGYKINRQTIFNYQTNKANIKDIIKKTDTIVPIGDIQDMISAFYYLRNQNLDILKAGDELQVNMFFDGKTFPFRLKFLKTEILKTSYGKIKTMVFKPFVQAGRVFKENESVTIWITADGNKIPIKIKASLAVGSLRAELEAYKGLANPFEIIF
ncbi:DUF3108 domain-containing protein [Tenacibaculum sp. UWU-22]|uniref:DUF3108 domain-containing protein n=1 Tax=Tenacibaculum sp. UWU-22 TaxID=3234187 RepID=UPI0034DAFAD4